MVRLDVKKKLSARSDRVKCVDVHPTEPWVLSSLYNGHVYIWNYVNQNLVKTFEVNDLPVRTARFVSRKQWVLAGSDDMNIRVYNYNTMEKIKTFEAHSDYIRCMVVHPTQPYVLSSSDDMTIKLWDWEKNWMNTQVFEGHSHYVMMLAINPKDTNTFASASLDRTIKVWGFGSATAHFTLEGHEKGVNCVEYFIGGDKPYLISGADDKLVKIWDYQNKTCVQTLEGHTHNVSVVCFHPELPIIISGSEDGTVRIWHANTYRLEKTLNYGMERVWAVGSLKGSNMLALGYDEGTVVIKLGREVPAVSMDQNGKIIWARHNEIQTASIKAAADTGIADGERLQLAVKDLGNCEIFPQMLHHNSNGRFVVVCGDGEYIIYTALAWRNKSFGSALDFVWASDTGEYAVRESSSKIKIFKNFKEERIFRPSFSAEGLFGGNLLSVKGRDFVCIYDWDQCRLIRRIDVTPKQVYWSDNSELVAITCESAFYILKYQKDVVTQFFNSGAEPDEEGIEDSFEILHEIPERVRTAYWVGDCFIYTNSNNRLNYCVGGETVTLSHLDRNMYLLGYIPRDNRLYLIDKALSVVSYTLHLTIVNYQTAVLRGDLALANEILPKIPMEQRNRIALFLDSQDLKEEALRVSLDPDHKFELAVQLGKLEVAHEIATESASEQKWKQLGDLALASSKLDLVEKCLWSARDVGGLLLLYTSVGNSEGLDKLAKLAIEEGKNNAAFACYFLQHKLEECLNLLCETGRIPEAAFFARTYLPSHVSQIVKLWKEDLQTINQKAAESLADPLEYQNLFPDLGLALKAEKHFSREKGLLASEYVNHMDDLERDLIQEIQDLGVEDLEEEEFVQVPSNSSPQESKKAVVTPEQQPVAPMSPVAPVAAPSSPVAAPASPVVEKVEPAKEAEKATPSDELDEDQLAKELGMWE